MQCEVCGSENAKKRVIIDGSELNACDSCATFGRQVEQGPRIVIHKVERYSKEEELPALKDNYGEIIRKAREARALTIEEFAHNVFESASLIKKIEHNKLKPDRKLIAKLEKALSVKITGE